MGVDADVLAYRRGAAFGGFEKAEEAAAKTACEVGELGDVVALEGVEDFPAEVEDDDQDEGKGNVVFSVVGEGGEEYHHEDDARGAEQGVREKADIEDAGDKAGNDDHQEHRERTVGFFEHGAEQEYVGEVADEMVPVGVARDMGEEPEVVERIEEVEQERVRHGEEGADEAVEVVLVECDDEGTEKGVGERGRGVVFNSHTSA